MQMKNSEWLLVFILTEKTIRDYFTSTFPYEAYPPDWHMQNFLKIYLCKVYNSSMKATAAQSLKKCARGGEGKCVSRDLLLYDWEVIQQSKDGCGSCNRGGSDTWRLCRLGSVHFSLLRSPYPQNGDISINLSLIRLF